MFKDLTDFEMEPIINLAKNRIYRSGTHIFMQGDPLTNVYFIHKGLVKIYKTDIHGKEQIVNMLQPGDMFPHQGFFRQDDYPAHAEVTEDAVLIYIPIHSFENFLITHPEICIKLFRVLGDKIVDLQNRLQEKILHNTYEQIILLLLRLAKNHGREVSDTHTVIDTQFTNREMANMIGSSRETVSRTLTQLKKKDFIQTDKTGLLQINTEALEDELF
ncbi:Crp/Fnr family transcriptional regulator [Virgibacillus halodenitrificans]|uniref:Crp/Fnr family transcriptional regulator n=2 Tax=Virgibacillus halodenitrificans TaxID=1482 RepID=A0AAC9J3U8_VIRHA|nr:Crp/Fnr family transcriptional regulator [Virgibacillus halodenitrificans]APC50179.1 Crp/Fnr family transcriptional regulator [Virgibacillus halodenitrificans]MBD1221780.1 Crp/Fnr family transcriptional regulator [Virgibacillus halodenitrificans]MCG1030154.1 Crp/Fnr family transcriptional regulator [Virgibacillus halodenitrificans]MYL57785.1 cyclic nucleotide-binding domain-containing protein [Virgibacillus halodenitrificans]